MTIKLSPTALNLFLECPRCFWLEQNKGLKRPRGIFPSLPGGMDARIKEYFDVCRQKGRLPVELEGKVAGKLLGDQSLMDQWRAREGGLRYEDKEKDAFLKGLLDDCLVEEGDYIPLDYKTHGYGPKEENLAGYYQNQLDCYCFLLEQNHYRTRPYAYLVYYTPKIVGEKGKVEFLVEPFKLKTDTSRARKTFESAIALLKGPLPSVRERCEYCALEQRADRASV